MSKVKSILKRFDEYQRRQPWLGFPIAVGKKFSDDRAGYLAALVAYYAFFSLFPLLLVLVSALGFLLGRRSEFKQKVLDSVLTQFPIIGDQIRENVSSIQGSGFALAVGIVGTLLAGMGVIQALQYGMDEIWNIPFTRRPNFIVSRLRALVMLVVLGGGTIVATVLAGVGAGGTSGVWSIPLRIGGLAGSVAVNLALFMVAFRVLTVAKVSWSDVFPGSLLAAILWAILQGLGGFVVGRQLRDASQVYGFFGIVIGLLSWLYLGGQLTLLAAEVNVVRASRLWPRNVDKTAPRTPAEEQALARLAHEEQRHPSEDIDVDFDASSTKAP